MSSVSGKTRKPSPTLDLWGVTDDTLLTHRDTLVSINKCFSVDVPNTKVFTIDVNGNSIYGDPLGGDDFQLDQCFK